MVNDVDARRDYAAYALEAIRRAAESGHLDFAGRRVQNDCADLGYSVDDVCDCVATLEEAHFSHSERYGSGPAWFDVYRRRYRAPNGQYDDLYVKLRLVGSRLVVAVCSFHVSR